MVLDPQRWLENCRNISELFSAIPSVLIRNCSLSQCAVELVDRLPSDHVVQGGSGLVDAQIVRQVVGVGRQVVANVRAIDVLHVVAGDGRSTLSRTQIRRGAVTRGSRAREINARLDGVRLVAGIKNIPDPFDLCFHPDVLNGDINERGDQPRACARRRGVHGIDRNLSLPKEIAQTANIAGLHAVPLSRLSCT
ncbi:hypothetical protein D9M68_720640 [compost metagenome]